MTATSFPILINYTQVVVYRRNLDRPGLLWTDQHVAQGFAWDDGIVAFGVPDHDGECMIELTTDAAATDTRTEASLWSVAVPFESTQPGIEVGTVLDERPFSLELGSYQLVFEAHPGETSGGKTYAYLLRLLFIKSGTPEFAILKQGELGSGQVLTKTAQRA